MEILEFGDKNNKKLIFIHGFQSVWQRWERYKEQAIVKALVEIMTCV